MNKEEKINEISEMIKDFMRYFNEEEINEFYYKVMFLLETKKRIEADLVEKVD